MHYPVTRNMLNERLSHHARQANLIQLAFEALESGREAVCQVHIQTNWPDQEPIMAEGSSPAEALEKAKRLWKEINPGTRGPTDPELFLKVGGLCIAVSPKDAGEGFTLDSRVGKRLGQMVFSEGEPLPSFWYAKSPTPEPAPVVSA